MKKKMIFLLFLFICLPRTLIFLSFPPFFVADGITKSFLGYFAVRQREMGRKSKRRERRKRKKRRRKKSRRRKKGKEKRGGRRGRKGE